MKPENKYFLPEHKQDGWYYIMPGDMGPPGHPQAVDILVGPYKDYNEICQAIGEFAFYMKERAFGKVPFKH